MATADTNTSARAIITVLGSDRSGIVAAVAGKLSAHDINILDISQTILEGIFTMTMLVDLKGVEASFAQVSEEFEQLSAELGVQITMQREDVFRFMHRI